MNEGPLLGSSGAIPKIPLYPGDKEMPVVLVTSKKVNELKTQLSL